MARGALLVAHRRVAAVGATCAGGAAGMPALRSEPEDSAPHGMRSQNLTGLTKKVRDNEAVRYRLEAGSLDTLGE